LTFRQCREGKPQEQVGGGVQWSGAEQYPDAAAHWQAEEQSGEPDDHCPLCRPDDNIRRQLADQRIQRVYRCRQQRFPAAALALADEGQRPQHQHADHDDDADQPRDDRPGGASLRIVGQSTSMEPPSSSENVVARFRQ